MNKYKILKGNDVLVGYAKTIQEATERCDRTKGLTLSPISERWDIEDKNLYVIWLCVNKMLESHGLTYTDVKKGAKYEFFEIKKVESRTFLFLSYKKTVREKVLWSHHLKFKNEQEFKDWKKYCLDLFKNQLRMSKRQAENEFRWFNLSYSLNQKYTDNDN